MRQVDSIFHGTEMGTYEIIFHYMSWTPSMGPWGIEGIRLTRMAELHWSESAQGSLPGEAALLDHRAQSGSNGLQQQF